MTAAHRANIHCFGTGPRPALALHCTLAHGGVWRTIGDALSDRVSITAPDLPSHGKSAAWDGPATYDDACIVLATPLMTGRVDLIGHSFGAVLALRLAVENPDLVRSLTLIEPVFFAVLKEKNHPAFAAYIAQAAPCREALKRGDHACAARLFNGLWGDGRKWEHFSPAAQKSMAERMHVIGGQDAFLMQDSAALLANGRLERLEIPTVLIKGSESPRVISDIHDVLMQRLPQVRRVVINGAGHMCPITHPQQVAGAIGDLLEMT